MVGILNDLLERKMDKINRNLERGKLLSAYLSLLSMCQDLEKDSLVSSLKELEKEPSIYLLHDTNTINQRNFWFFSFDHKRFFRSYPMTQIRQRITEITLTLEKTQNMLIFNPYKKSEDTGLKNILLKVNEEISKGIEK